MPTAEGGLAVSDLTGQAGSFRLGPVSLAIAPGQVLAALDIPAIHVTHDRDEALSISNDLAIITGGRLSQAGPASQVTAAPADPDTARLLGWTELGPGTADRGTVTTGQLRLPDAAPPGIHGAVRVFYRPEDLILGTPPAGTQSRRQPHRPGRAGPPHPAPGPHHPRRRPAPDRAAAAPGPPITPPAARRTDHRNSSPRQRPHLPRGTRHRLKQPARHPAMPAPRDRDASPGQSAIRPGTPAR